MKEFVINKVLTHNLILATSDSKEYILIGKGIGFGKKVNSTILENEVSNYYIIQNVDKLSAYEKLILNTPESVLLATEKAISHAEKKLDHTFDENIHISLLDHINFSIFRLENNLEVGSFLTDEYYLMYPEYYTVAEEMVEIINQELNIKLAKSEVGSIILHMHAAFSKEKVSNTALYAQVIAYSLQFIQDRLPKDISSNNLAKTRLITHLKFALKRAELNDLRDNPLADVIKEKYPDVYEVAYTLSKKLDEEFGVKLTESEVGYIALHVYNLQY